MITAAIVLLFLVPATFITWTSVRVLLAPEKDWASGHARWMVLGSTGSRAPRPEQREVRFWAAVWLLIAAAFVALGVAIALAQ
jgi:hypothetical protein